MIGIYQDNFIDYLKKNLGSVKLSSKNLITVCPWCEYGQQKDHYHLYISLEVPIFHCFHANCEKSGLLSKLLRHIEGHDISETFVDRLLLEESKNKRSVFQNLEKDKKSLIIPLIDPDRFKLKDYYIRRRLKFSQDNNQNIKGLIYDLNEFIKLNNIPQTEILIKLKEYLQNNFVGFLTENQTTIIFRNIEDSHSMRFFKYKFQTELFLDYYKLKGNKPNSNTVILAEGIFDIFSEQIFDFLKLKDEAKLYASALSSKYVSLIHSLVFYEQIFKIDVIILSDQGIDIKYYEKIKKYNKHVINSLTIYYNKAGKDFNDMPILAEKKIIK
jgi:hypothetical protein